MPAAPTPRPAAPAPAAPSPAELAKKDELVGLVIVGVATLGLLAVLAVQHIRFPSVHAVGDVLKAGLTWVAAIGIIGGGSALALFAGLHERFIFATIGIVAILVGLTLVGVTVGLPPQFEFIFGFLNAFAKLANLLINALSGIFRLFGVSA